MDKEINFLEVEGDSVEDAIKKGIDLLRTSAENVDIEILNEPSSNFLQFRRKKARVRITLLRGFVPANLLRKEETFEQEKLKKRKRFSVADVMENKPRERTKENIAEKNSEENTINTENKPNSFRQYREQRQQSANNQNQNKPKQNNTNQNENAEEEVTYEMTEEDKANIVKINTIFMKITNLMGFNVEPEINSLSNKYKIIIKDTSDASLLIGKSGKTIEALQYIVNKIAFKENVNKPVYLDIKGYIKQKRKNKFEKRWKR